MICRTIISLSLFHDIMFFEIIVRIIYFTVSITVSLLINKMKIVDEFFLFLIQIKKQRHIFVNNKLMFVFQEC